MFIFFSSLWIPRLRTEQHNNTHFNLLYYACKVVKPAGRRVFFGTVEGGRISIRFVPELLAAVPQPIPPQGHLLVFSAMLTTRLWRLLGKLSRILRSGGLW